MNLQKLIEEIKNGDEAAFAELYDRCKQHIALFCHRFSDTKEDAEEVLQDVFLAVHQNINSINPNAIMGYLRKTAVHKSINKRNANLRTLNYVATVEDDVLDNYPELNEEFLPEQYFLYKEKHIELHNALESLPEMQMKMIYMYYFAGFKTKEVAELLNVSQRHVINTLHIARNKLKSRLGELDGQEETSSNIAKKLLPLGALLVIEEQVFAATYISTAMTPSLAAATAATTAAATTGTAATTTTVATTTTATTAATTATGAAVVSTKILIAVAGVLVAGAVATTSYFVFRPANEDIPNEPNEPAYEMQVPHEYEDAQELAYEPTSESTDEATTEPVPESTDELIPESTPEPALEPTPEPTPGSTPESTPAPTPGSTPEPTPEPTPVPTPEPPPDRTQQILSTLSSASDAGSVNAIIGDYEFAFVRQMRSATGEVRRLYVTNEGSGDILIGTAVNGDGTGWRMRFQHFVGGVMPTDPMDQINFMD